MRISVILQETESFALTGGAFAMKTYETFRRFSLESQVNIFSRPVFKHAYQSENIHVRKVWSALLEHFPYAHKYYERFYGHAVAFRVSKDYDVAYICNRPNYVPLVRKSNKDIKIVLALGNTHLTNGWYDTATCRQAIELSSLIVVVSDYLRNDILRKYPFAKDKLLTIHNGIDTKKFVPLEAKNPDNPKTVLFVGRLTEEKGVHSLIKAMCKVFKVYPHVQLKIAGSCWFGETKSNPYVERLKSLSLEFQDKIIFTGYVRTDLLPQLYQSADIFVAPSIWEEAFGNTNLEAMACGLPVITSDRGGITEVVGDTGILIDPDNTDEIAQKILRLLADDDLRQTMGKKARERAVNHFSWDIAAAKVEQALANLT